jgi:hypothetical protein
MKNVLLVVGLVAVLMALARKPIAMLSEKIVDALQIFGQ